MRFMVVFLIFFNISLTSLARFFFVCVVVFIIGLVSI